MLFVIDGSLAAALKSDHKPTDAIIDAVEHIAIARREGKHLVFADRGTLQVLKESPWLSDRSRRVYTHLYSKLPQMRVYLDNLARHVKVLAQDGVFELNKDQSRQVIRLSANHFQDFSIVTEAVFLCENQIDATFFKTLTEAYLSWSRLGQIQLRFEPRGGGGQTTATEYESLRIRKNKLCLCIVDSDRKTPDGNIGDTARDVKRIDDEGHQPLCELHILNAREAENIIPTPLYQETVLGDPNRMQGVFALEQLESSNVPNARMYLDIKAGLKLGEIVHANPDSKFSRFWYQVVRDLKDKVDTLYDECWSDPGCEDKQSCRCIVASGMGQSILKDVTELLQRKSNQKIAETVREPLKAEWEEIGEIVTAWFCGSTHLRAV